MSLEPFKTLFHIYGKHTINSKTVDTFSHLTTFTIHAYVQLLFQLQSSRPWFVKNREWKREMC